MTATSAQMHHVEANPVFGDAEPVSSIKKDLKVFIERLPFRLEGHTSENGSPHIHFSGTKVDMLAKMALTQSDPQKRLLALTKCHSATIQISLHVNLLYVLLFSNNSIDLVLSSLAVSPPFYNRVDPSLMIWTTSREIALPILSENSAVNNAPAVMNGTNGMVRSKAICRSLGRTPSQVS